MLTVLLYVVGFALSCVAAFYSVTGLAFVFAGAFWPVVIMGSALESAKLVAASWVFRNWSRASRGLLTYLSIGVFLLMLLTGVGIFGYLSRAYLIQQAPVTQTMTDVASAERAVALAQAQYDRDAQAAKELNAGQTTDKVIGKLTDTDRLTGSSGAVTLLKTQQALQQAARKQLTASSAELAAAQKALATVQTSAQLQTVDLGPLMFAAKAWYGTSDVATMDKVVRWFILLIMCVFDPMAIALLLAAQQRTSAANVTAPVNPQITDAVTAVAPSSVDATIHPPIWPLSEHPSNTPSPASEHDEAILSTQTETSSLAEPSLEATQLPLPTPARRSKGQGLRAATVRNLRS